MRVNGALNTAGLLTVDGFGTHSFIGSGTGAHTLGLRNAAAGTGNYTSLQVGNDFDPGALQLLVTSSNYVGLPSDGAMVFAGRPSGLGLYATHGAGQIRFYTGGTVERARLDASGVLTVNGFGAHTFSAGATGGNSLVVRNTAAGASNLAGVTVGNDIAGNRTQIVTTSSTYTPSGRLFADCTTFEGFGAGGVGIFAGHASGVIRFHTGPGETERARFSAAGELLIGKTAANGGCGVLQVNSNQTANWGLGLKAVVNTNGGYFIGFINASDTVQGNITSGGTGTTIAYNTSSDARLKIDDGRATNLSALRAIAVHDFRWKVDGHADRGVFAQEAHPVFPRAISVGDDSTTADGHLARPWMTDYSKFTPDLIVGWQQHDAALQTLAARLAALEQRI